MLPSPVINTAMPRFHTPIVTVASNFLEQRERGRRDGATARPPIIARAPARMAPKAQIRQLTSEPSRPYGSGHVNNLSTRCYP
jgi:hypothetical protein